MESKDKMFWTGSGENMITSEIATKMEAMPPAAKHFMELLIWQDLGARAGRRTRTVVIAIGGALIKQCVMLLISGIDASVISDALHKTASKAVEILSVPTEITDRDFLLINGGGAPVIELSRQLNAWANVLHGMERNCVKSFAEALEDIPCTLVENVVQPPLVSACGISVAIEVVTNFLKNLKAILSQP